MTTPASQKTYMDIRCGRVSDGRSSRRGVPRFCMERSAWDCSIKSRIDTLGRRCWKRPVNSAQNREEVAPTQPTELLIDTNADLSMAWSRFSTSRWRALVIGYGSSDAFLQLESPAIVRSGCCVMFRPKKAQKYRNFRYRDESKLIVNLNDLTINERDLASEKDVVYILCSKWNDSAVG